MAARGLAKYLRSATIVLPLDGITKIFPNAFERVRAFSICLKEREILLGRKRVQKLSVVY